MTLKATCLLGSIVILVSACQRVEPRHPAVAGNRELTVVSTGVCALRKDVKGSWSVFIPQATEPTLSQTSPEHPIPGHRPYLSVMIAQGDSIFPAGARLPDFYFEKNVGNDQYHRYGVFLLDKQTLSLKGATPATSTVKPGDNDGEIVSFGKVCCIVNKTKPDVTSLAAAVELGPGTLLPRAGTWEKWYFGPGPEEGCPADYAGTATEMARQVYLRFQFPENKFALIDVKNKQHSIEFANVTRDLEIEIGNAPVEDILGVGTNHPEKVDRHFELLYSLLPASNPHPGKPHVPIVEPEVTPVGPGITKPGGSNCPPVTWP